MAIQTTGSLKNIQVITQMMKRLNTYKYLFGEVTLK